MGSKVEDNLLETNLARMVEMLGQLEKWSANVRFFISPTGRRWVKIVAALGPGDGVRTHAVEITDDVPAAVALMVGVCHLRRLARERDREKGS